MEEEKTPRKRQALAAGISLVVHALLLLLLAFITLKASKRDEYREDGIPVLLGEVPDASGMNIGGLPSSDQSETQEATNTNDNASEATAVEATAEVPRKSLLQPLFHAKAPLQLSQRLLQNLPRSLSSPRKKKNP